MPNLNLDRRETSEATQPSAGPRVTADRFLPTTLQREQEQL
jgi:hypothetical protein